MMDYLPLWQISMPTSTGLMLSPRWSPNRHADVSAAVATSTNAINAHFIARGNPVACWLASRVRKERVRRTTINIAKAATAAFGSQVEKVEATNNASDSSSAPSTDSR